MELSARAIERRLAREPRALLATLRRDGGAALVPIVFARAGDALWSPVDAKPKQSAALARLVNIAREPRVALLLDHYDADWSLLWWLRIGGVANALHAESEASAPAGFARAAAALRAKYPQYGVTALFQGEPTLLRIEIERVTSWAASPAAMALAEEAP